MHRTSLAALLALSLALPTLASADVVSDFSAGVQGWSVVSFGDLPSGNYALSGTYAATYNPTGGHPGGYISSTDPDGGDFTFSAPGAYLGNVSSATGLSYDLVQFESTGYQTTDVLLVGANGTRLAWQSPTALATGGVWTAVSLSFAPSAAWHVGTPSGTLATAADFTGVLGNLSGLYIRGEYAFGADNTGIDNVNLMGVAAVPEPETLALMLAGVGAVGFISRRRRAD